MFDFGERAGLLAAVHRAPLEDLFVTRPLNATLKRILHAFEVEETELYALVSLFSADPQPVNPRVLAREGLRDSAAVETALTHLEQMAVVRRGGPNVEGSTVQLTDMGRELTVWLIYRVVMAARECLADPPKR